MPSETIATLVAAARNNAEWCAAVCRSHDIAGAFGPKAWSSARRPPTYYPDAISLQPGAVFADLRLVPSAASPGCSIKDSFADIDLAADGFDELFTAQWIHRPAGEPAPETPALRADPVRTGDELLDWQAAWHGGDGAPDIFRLALLEDPAVVILAVRDGVDLAGGVVLNHGVGLVGVSNLFAVDDSRIEGIWSSAITAAAVHFPGVPLIGYEQADGLPPALSSRFNTIGELRVWLFRS